MTRWAFDHCAALLDQRLRFRKAVSALTDGRDQQQPSSIGNAELADELLPNLLTVLP